MFDSILFVAAIALAMWLSYVVLARHQKARAREEFLRAAIAEARLRANKAEHDLAANLIENEALRRQINGLTEILALLSAETAALLGDQDHTGESVPQNVVKFPIPSQEPRILELSEGM